MRPHPFQAQVGDAAPTPEGDWSQPPPDGGRGPAPIPARHGTQPFQAERRGPVPTPVGLWTPATTCTGQEPLATSSAGEDPYSFCWREVTPVPAPGKGGTPTPASKRREPCALSEWGARLQHLLEKGGDPAHTPAYERILGHPCGIREPCAHANHEQEGPRPPWWREGTNSQTLSSRERRTRDRSRCRWELSSFRWREKTQTLPSSEGHAPTPLL